MKDLEKRKTKEIEGLKSERDFIQVFNLSLFI